MTYYISRTVTGAFDATVQRVIDLLKQEGFGVLTDIDVQATLKAKIGADVTPYRILGACNPGIAHKAMELENKLGVLLPCNVIVRDAGGGKTEVASIDPVSSMQRTGNPKLEGVAAQVREQLQRVIDAL